MDQMADNIKQAWYEGKFREGTSEDGVVTKGENEYWMGFAVGLHEFLRVELVEVRKP